MAKVTDYLLYLVLGLGAGAAYAFLGIGLVLNYRISGVLNLAIGAVAMYSTYVYALLRAQGSYLNPVFGTPPLIELGKPMGFLPAAAVAIATGAVLGLVLYAVVFRPLANALPISRLVASIGVMVFLQALVGLRAGSTFVIVQPIFPSTTFGMAGVRVPLDRLYMAGAAVVLLLVLTALYRLTRFGLASEALAESTQGAQIVGISPRGVPAVNWAISGVVAAIGGIMISPLIPLSPSAYSLLTIPALAAALAGRLTSMAITVAAAFALGMCESLVSFLPSKEWFPGQLGSQVGNALPVILIVLILVMRSETMPGRGHILGASLPVAHRPERMWSGVLIGGGVAAASLFLLHGSLRGAVITTMTLAILALSMVVVTGYLGQLSLAQLSLSGVAAFSLVTFTSEWSWPFPVALAAAVVVAAVVGVAIGLPALRVRGLELGVVTLAAGVALSSVWFRNPGFTGGGSAIAPPEIFGLDLSIRGAGYPRVAFGLTVLFFLLAACLLVAHLRRSRFGSEMLAIRANERAASALGIDVARVKILAFAVSSSLAGLAGALIAYQGMIVVPEKYDIFLGLAAFAVAFLAGITNISGAVLAGVLGPLGVGAVLLDRYLHLGSYFDVLVGAALVVMAINHPAGITGDVYSIRDRRRRRRAAGALDSRRATRPETPGPVKGVSEVV
ncbi:ABC transporter permease [Nocardioides sp.]|uniref:ABC transporter permease n=1 Tax=Nocardioides sp. TaxID=35761 RepID=UPI0039E6CDE2